MRLMITGGAGCLGSNLVERYFPQGYEICVIDNFATGNREVLPPQPGLKVVEGSIADADLVNQTFEAFQPTHVIHSAAAYKDPMDWREDAATNVLGTIHVAKAAAAHNVARLINFQTALCYGRPKAVPIGVEQPTAPFTSYGISKTAGEAYLMQSGLNVVSFRLATVLAPRFVIGAVPTFYQRLKAGKACFCSATVRDFMDITDFASLIDKALSPDAPQGVYNASPGTGVSMREIHDLVAEYLGIRLSQEPPDVPPGPDDVAEVVLDPTVTEHTYGWRVETTFKESLSKMLSWYETHGLSTVYSHVRKPDGAGQERI